jgi:NADPH:quinone reductase-like Zn-dependent oxidoreductase
MLSKKLPAKVANRFVSEQLKTFIANVKKDDLVALKDLIETGDVRPVVGRTYELNEVPEAIRYVETGHARGKVVVTI